MNILIVTAHPSPEGLTHAIANTYAEAKKAKGHTVELVNLYAKEFTIDDLQFKDIKDYTISSVQKKFHKQLQDAHEIVVVHPVWWGTPPSIMKRWVELAFWKGVAYHYTHEGKLEKLLIGKSAKIFVTCGGPGWIYKLPFMPLKSFWGINLFEYCGIDIVTTQICGDLNKITNELQRKKHVDKFLKKIKKA
jgi:NAD(P)H dehydrogenase (quinone)